MFWSEQLYANIMYIGLHILTLWNILALGHLAMQCTVYYELSNKMQPVYPVKMDVGLLSVYDAIQKAYNTRICRTVTFVSFLPTARGVVIVL